MENRVSADLEDGDWIMDFLVDADINTKKSWGAGFRELFYVDVDGNIFITLDL